jgi:hypothetical protein
MDEEPPFPPPPPPHALVRSSDKINPGNTNVRSTRAS